jgi:dTDP-4-dehydrorhamnose reductase
MPGVETFCEDLTNRPSTRGLLEKIRPTAIIHCAAATDVDWCEDHPNEAYELNATVSGELASMAAELGARFVYVSTDAVFDGNKGNYCEQDQPAPLSAYARSKWHGEQMVLQRNAQAAIARVTIYGWNAQEKLSLGEWILQRLMEGAQVPGFTDVYFTPILATDLAQSVLAILERSLAGVYHVVGAERISKFEFARRVAQAFGFHPSRITPACLADAKLRARRPRDVSLNTTKFREATRRTLPDVKSGILRFREQRDNGYAQQLKSYLMAEVE